jgi:hypothetical protein
MTQAPPAVVKIPTESPQPAPGKAAKPSGRAKVVSRLRSRFVVNPRRTRVAAVRRGFVVRQVTAPVSAEWEVMCASA